MTHPYASFLVSGGAFDSTRVELVSADTNAPIYSISGADQRTLRPAVVDLGAHLGKDIFVRLVDDEAGAPTAVYIRENPWAHINFDHFRFHESKPFFVNEITPADITTMPPMDPVHARGPVGGGRSPRHDRAQGLFGDAGGVGARCRAANRFCATTTAAGCGSLKRTRIPCAQPKAKGRTGF